MEQQSNVNLPTHIIEEEIMLRLPVKTLMRFKCVCKRWLSLIESRSFIDRHYSRERDDDRLILHCYHDRNKPILFEEIIEVNPSLGFPQSDDIVKLMGPQLGLFCQLTSDGDITLFNPAARMSKRVPPHELLDWNNIPPSTYIYGFGLDPLTQGYKIVGFHQPWKEPTTSVCIYNSITDSWKLIKVSRMDSMNGAFIYNPQTFVNGVYYWLTQPWSWPRDKIIDSVVLAFDMGIERFREIQLPHQNTATRYRIIYKNLVQVGDSLGVLTFETEWVDLWVMGKQGFWTRSSRVGPFEILPKSLCMWKNELVLSSYGSSDHLILTDVSTKKQRKIAILQLTDNYMYSAFFYKESLVSIEGASSYGN